MPYYDDVTGNPYGTAMGINMNSNLNMGMGMEMIHSDATDANLLSAMDPSKMNHMQYEETDYSSGRNARIIREIIV